MQIGQTAIFLATNFNKVDCLKLLVDSGADKNVRDVVSHVVENILI